MNLPKLIFLSLAAAVASAQTPEPVRSPEVLSDGRVTFRIAAPKAAEVTFKPDWSTDASKMERGDDGVWSITVGPLAPSTYIYSFNVDGISLADPVNPAIKLRMRGSGSLVDIPSVPPGMGDARDVPHGAVEINWLKSATLSGEARQVWVYTPPGYAEMADKRYPVLYLLHGNNDRPAGWIDVGHLNFIVDNLIAEGKVRPLMIVMPFGHALPFGQPAVPPKTNTAVVEEYLLSDVLPQVAAKYRLQGGPRHTAIAGMSMGAEQALHIGFHHLDLFRSIGAFSPPRAAAAEIEKGPWLADAVTTNASLDLLWLGCGRQEPSFASAEGLAQKLTLQGVKHTWFPNDGVHNYALWRQHLVEFLPQLFREKR